MAWPITTAGLPARGVQYGCRGGAGPRPTGSTPGHRILRSARSKRPESGRRRSSDTFIASHTHANTPVFLLFPDDSAGRAARRLRIRRRGGRARRRRPGWTRRRGGRLGARRHGPGRRQAGPGDHRRRGDGRGVLDRSGPLAGNGSVERDPLCRGRRGPEGPDPVHSGRASVPDRTGAGAGGPRQGHRAGEECAVAECALPGSVQPRADSARSGTKPRPPARHRSRPPSPPTRRRYVRRA